MNGKRPDLTTVPLLVIDDLGMRKLPTTAAEELLEQRDHTDPNVATNGTGLRCAKGYVH